MDNWEIIIRLLVAGVLGALIGLDREYRAKEAGYRTHLLVCLGSALMMIVSKYGFGDCLREGVVRLDPSRIAAQVVTGIGFIGAGTIIFQRQVVHGLTTAAGIWTAAGIGLAIGAGMYVVGIAATLLTLVALELLNRFFKKIGLKSIGITLTTSRSTIAGEIATLCREHDLRLVSYRMEKLAHSDNELYEVAFVIKSKRMMDEAAVVALFNNCSDVVIERVE